MAALGPISASEIMYALLAEQRAGDAVEPPGCGTMSGKVVRLNKSLYGLKQASRTFRNRFVSDLKRIGFEQSLSDPCVLCFMMGDEVMGMVAIHVDDILYAGTKSLAKVVVEALGDSLPCLLYTSPSPRDRQKSRMPSSA